MDVPHDFPIQCCGVSGFISVVREYIITLKDGRPFRFEWHKFCGPVFLGEKGNPLDKQPSERHPVWEAIELWCKQGHRVDETGNAIWEPFDEMEGFPVAHMRGAALPTSAEADLTTAYTRTARTL